MNRRILKKLSKKAVPILIQRHGLHLADFTLSDGTETIDAPKGWPRRQLSRSRGVPMPYATPLKGTPMYWRQTSYECNEWDCEPAAITLSETEFWENLSEADALAMLGESVKR